MGKEKQIKEPEIYDRKTALRVLQDISNKMYPNLDIFGKPTLVIDRPKFEEVRKKYLDELPKDNIVLPEQSYEQLTTQYKSLEIKYSILVEDYRLCKDANETLKQKVMESSKNAVDKFVNTLKTLIDMNDNIARVLAGWTTNEILALIEGTAKHPKNYI